MCLINCSHLAELIAIAKAEDLGAGDLTSALLADPCEPASFRLLAKEPCTVAGVEIAPLILRAYDEAIELVWAEGKVDGVAVGKVPSELGGIHGPLASVLAAERVLLNFLQRLCGIATTTRAYVDAVAGTCANIFDTRKTTPGLRSLEKYAVRCGGGTNHRLGLHDAVLIKDNHLVGIEPARLSETVLAMLNRMEEQGIKPVFVEVEADDLQQVNELLTVASLDVILLDNFSQDDLRKAVETRDRQGLRGSVALEASGGVTLETVRAIAETGVDRISVGAITHSAKAIDLSLERV